MKSSTIYSDKDGVLRVLTVEVPKEPKLEFALCRVECGQWLCRCQLYTDQYREYEQALQACKDTSVPVEDQEAAKDFMWRNDQRINSPIPKLFWWENMIRPDTIYTVPEFEYVFTAYGEVINDPHLWKKEFVFARLVSHQTGNAV